MTYILLPRNAQSLGATRLPSQLRPRPEFLIQQLELTITAKPPLWDHQKEKVAIIV